MTDETIQAGVAIAQDALYFAIWNNGQITSGQARQAIKILFGDEVDKALALKYDKSKPIG